MKLVYKQMRESTERKQEDWAVSEGLQFSIVSVRAEEMTIRSHINYDQFLSPKTERSFENASKRIEFRRRPC